jgi:hypothetical protein
MGCPWSGRGVLIEPKRAPGDKPLGALPRHWHAEPVRRFADLRLGLVATVLLAVLAAVAATERAHLPSSGSTLASSAAGASIGLGVGAAFSVLFFLLLSVLRRGALGGVTVRRRPWWHSLVATAVVLGLFALALTGLLHHAHGRLRGQGESGSGQPRSLHAATGRVNTATRTATQDALLVGLALVPAAMLFFAATHRRRWASRAVPVPADDERATLIEAVAAGADELDQIRDPRAAVVACYLAMERSMSNAGTTRHPAETPSELLARAADADLVPAGPTAELVRLFEEARFSTHPMDGSHRDRARAALAAVRRHLDRTAVDV